MKKIVLLAMLVLMCIGTATSNAEVEKKFDRFTNITTIGTTPTANCHHQLSVRWDSKGVCLSMFVHTSNTWQYLQCHPVYLLVDGNPFRSIRTTHNGRVGRGFVLEFIRIDLTYNEIKELSKSTKIEVKLCNTEFTIPERDMQDLRTFVELVEKEIGR